MEREMELAQVGRLRRPTHKGPAENAFFELLLQIYTKGLTFLKIKFIGDIR